MLTAAAMHTQLTLGIPGFTYADLYSPSRLRDLYERWYDELRADDAALADRYDRWRGGGGDGVGPVELSELLVALAPTVSRFVVRLFAVDAAWSSQQRRVADELQLFRFKDEFVKRRALKRKAGSPTASEPEQASSRGAG